MEIRVEDFETAALPHLNDLFRTATGMLGSRSEAEDLVQEVYLEAWKSFHRFELGTNCRAWLYKILFHRLHHHRRKWFIWKFKTEGDDDLQRSLAYEPPVEDKLTDEEVLAGVNKVPEQFREVLLLADVEEFAYKEIASMLAIPVGTVMSRLSRGRKYLRAELGEVARQMGIGQKGQEGISA